MGHSITYQGRVWDAGEEESITYTKSTCRVTTGRGCFQGRNTFIYFKITPKGSTLLFEPLSVSLVEPKVCLLCIIPLRFIR